MYFMSHVRMYVQNKMTLDGKLFTEMSSGSPTLKLC